MSKWAWLDDTEGGIIMRDGVEVDPDKILCFLNANDELVAALEEIAETPHQSYENVKGDYGMDYGKGVANGHLFCANVAKAALWVAKGGA